MWLIRDRAGDRETSRVPLRYPSRGKLETNVPGGMRDDSERRDEEYMFEGGTDSGSEHVGFASALTGHSQERHCCQAPTKPVGGCPGNVE